MLSFFVQLDPALQTFVELGVTFVFGYLVLQLANLSPALSEYLGQYKVGIVTWLTGLAVQLVQAQLNRIPANWDEVVFIAQKLLAEVLLVLLGFAAIRAKKAFGHTAL
jgi:hypothetical protein